MTSVKMTLQIFAMGGPVFVKYKKNNNYLKQLSCSVSESFKIDTS